MKISEVMRPGAFTISETDCLGVAQAAMTRAQIRHLPVVAKGRVVGMLSERDVLAARAHAADTEGHWWSISVHDAMRSPAQTAHPDDSVTEVVGRMAWAKIGAMPVVELGKVLGIATVNDVLDAEVRIAMGPTPLATLTAADVMTPFPITVRPDAGLSVAVGAMTGHRIRHLPVVEHDGTLVGMLSEGDLRAVISDPAHYLANRFAVEIGELRVRDVMHHPPITARFDSPLVELATKFADARIAAIPVLDAFGALIGIVSYVDALRVLAS